MSAMPIGDVSGKTLQQLISLKGRAAVITGAARGIGFAIARRLAEAGASVAIADIDAVGASAAAQALAKEFGGGSQGFAADVGEEKSVVALADATIDCFGRIDIWINNAGIFPGRPTVELSPEEWDHVLAVNLRGVFLGAREAARHMAANRPRGGVIINVASVAGFAGRRGLAAYTASKHGVVGLTKSLALEFGPDDIRVLGLAPTGVTTPGVAARKEAATGAEAERIRKRSESIVAGLPLGRLGVPDDIARVALFCASDLAMLMTGATIPVDAGALAG